MLRWWLFQLFVTFIYVKERILFCNDQVWDFSWFLWLLHMSFLSSSIRRWLSVWSKNKNIRGFWSYWLAFHVIPRPRLWIRLIMDIQFVTDKKILGNTIDMNVWFGCLSVQLWNKNVSFSGGIAISFSFKMSMFKLNVRILTT